MITLRQLARLAGVSRTTVMRALHNASDVAETTREHVLALAREHHYIPLVRMPASASLHHRIIGLVTPIAVHTALEARIVERLNAVCLKHQYTYITRFSECLLVRTIAVLQELIALEVDALLIHSGYYHPLPADVIHRFQQRRIPVVTYDTTPTETPVDWVGTDEAATGEMAVDYLHRLGHRRIAFMGYLPKEATIYGRPRAVQDALLRRGLSTEWFIDVDFTDVSVLLTNFLRSAHAPTAIIAQNDQLALIAIHEARQLHISVPSDLSVLGFGGYPFSAYSYPPITTVMQPSDEVARLAIDLLFMRLADQTPWEERQAKRVAVPPPRLIERSSCASLPAPR